MVVLAVRVHDVSDELQTLIDEEATTPQQIARRPLGAGINIRHRKHAAAKQARYFCIGYKAGSLRERVYRLLKYGQAYVRQSEEAYNEAYRLRQLKAMAKKAASLGYKLVPETMSP